MQTLLIAKWVKQTNLEDSTIFRSTRLWEKTNKHTQPKVFYIQINTIKQLHRKDDFVEVGFFYLLLFYFNASLKTRWVDTPTLTSSTIPFTTVGARTKQSLHSILVRSVQKAGVSRFFETVYSRLLINHFVD